MRGRRLMGLVSAYLIISSLNGFGTGGREGTPTALGSLAASGTILVDNEPAPSATMLFAGDVISTGKASTAVMSFRSGTSATIAENSEVALSPDVSSTNLNLRQGTLVIRTMDSQPARVSVLGTSVIVQGQAGFPTICSIASVGGSAAVFASQGHVEIHGRGGPEILPPGKYARIEAGRVPGGGQQQAGKVNNAIPAEVVQHQGKGAEIVLKINDVVNWEDLVKTLRTGRVRIELLDGSFLNVGARSVMRITKHDLQTQQTQIEFTLGRLRGEVVKLTKGGANFEVRTQTAVIGVVGTIFLIRAQVNLTRVFCTEGTLTVRNINPAIVGQLTLHQGEFTTVARSFPPTGAVHAPAAQMQTEVNQTTVHGPGVAGGGGVGGAPSGAVTTTTTASNAVSAGASATSAGLGAGAASSLSAAQTSIATAQSSLTQAVTTTNAATTADTAAGTAATQAVNSATSVSVGVTTVVQTVSPSAPGCGCQ